MGRKGNRGGPWLYQIIAFPQMGLKIQPNPLSKWRPIHGELFRWWLSAPKCALNLLQPNNMVVKNDISVNKKHNNICHKKSQWWTVNVIEGKKRKWQPSSFGTINKWPPTVRLTLLCLQYCSYCSSLLLGLEKKYRKSQIIPKSYQNQTEKILNKKSQNF